MKHVMRSAVPSVVLVAVPAIMSGQSLDATGRHHTNPSEVIGVTPSPDSVNRTRVRLAWAGGGAQPIATQVGRRAGT